MKCRTRRRKIDPDPNLGFGYCYVHRAILDDGECPVARYEQALLQRLREEFVRFLTVDSETKDARRREFNQAIFVPEDAEYAPGHACWTGTDLWMVLEKFDKAVKNINQRKKS